MSSGSDEADGENSVRGCGSTSTPDRSFGSIASYSEGAPVSAAGSGSHTSSDSEPVAASRFGGSGSLKASAIDSASGAACRLSGKTDTAESVFDSALSRFREMPRINERFRILVAIEPAWAENCFDDPSEEEENGGCPNFDPMRAPQSSAKGASTPLGSDA